MKKHIFREYDIRGIVGKEFEIEEAAALAKAIVTYFKIKNPNTKTITIARDGRIHSEIISKYVINAILDSGFDVLDIGICPTPVFYFSLFNNPMSSTGFIITASHNPKEYNGFKICLDKKSVWGSQIQEISKILETQNFSHENRKASYLTHDTKIDYINFLTEHFSELKNKEINTIIDCGNGAAGTVLPDLIKKLNLKNITLLFEQVDGNFPNHEADPTNIKNMLNVAQLLKNDNSLKFGLGLDGDCDRMSPMTKEGFLVPGDQLLSIYAKEILQKYPAAPIVFDIKASSGLAEIIEKFGGKAIVSPSGHSLVKNSMYENKAKLAGELSCHFFFNDRYYGYDDGIYAALRLFEILQNTSISLANLIKIFPKKESSPEFRINCEESQKTEIVNNLKNIFASKPETKVLTIDGVKAEFNYGWGLARASNTQSVICFRFESDTKEGLKMVKQNFYDALLPFFDGNSLKNEIQL